MSQIIIGRVDNMEEPEQAAPVIECTWCGDSCGEPVCYSCQDTFDMFGMDPEDF